MKKIMSIFLIAFVYSTFCVNIFASELTTNVVEQPCRTDVEMINLILSIIRDKIGYIFLFLSLLFILIYIIMNGIHRLLIKIFTKMDYVKVGPLTFKNKKETDTNSNTCTLNCPNDEKLHLLIDNIKNTSEVEKDRLFINIDNSIDNIMKLKEIYENTMYTTFDKLSNVIKKLYYDKLLELVNTKIPFIAESTDSNKIMHTREYFFIVNLIQNFTNEWKKQIDIILKSNGFETFLDDKTLLNSYITDLQHCVFYNIDYNMLNLTDLNYTDIEDTLTQCNKTNYDLFEDMLIKLCLAKLNLIKRYKSKVDEIHKLIDLSINNIIDDIILFETKESESKDDENDTLEGKV